MIPPVFALKDSTVRSETSGDGSESKKHTSSPSPVTDLSAQAGRFADNLDKTLSQMAKTLATPESFEATQRVLAEMLIKRTESRDKLLAIKAQLINYTAGVSSTTRGS